MPAPNYKMIAVDVGDLLKYDTSVNEIDRIAGAVFPFARESFPNDAITSVRARMIYDWILSLAKQKMNAESREDLLISFCRNIGGEKFGEDIEKILARNGIGKRAINKGHLEEFMSRDFHQEINKHSRKLFLESNYFHAVFEAAKAYNKLVREKARSTRDGQSLMLEVWGWERGVLKVTPCLTDTDKNVQDGIKFLSAGLMQAIRNPTAHEPAVDWPISKRDCLDILSFISFLFRKLDDATYFAG